MTSSAIEKAKDLLSAIDEDANIEDSDIKTALLSASFNRSLPIMQELIREMKGISNKVVYIEAIQGIFNFWGGQNEVPEPIKVATLYQRNIKGVLPDIAVPDSIRNLITS